MDQQNPIQDAPQSDPSDKDESKVSKKSWPWIITGLVIAIVILWNQHLADIKELRTSDKERINDAKELGFAWEQVAKERRDLKVSTEVLIRFTNDSNIINRIDSARKAEQSR